MLISSIIFRIIFAILFLSFAIDNVTVNGWNFFAILLVAFATFDIFNAFQLFKVYRALRHH